MKTKITSFFTDRRIAFIALITSAITPFIPYVIDYFKVDEMKVILANQMYVSSYYGNLGISIPVTISNLGENRGSISKMRVFIKKNEGSTYKKTFDCQDFNYQNQSGGISKFPPEQMIFRPDDQGSYSAMFYPVTSKKIEEIQTNFSEMIFKEIIIKNKKKIPQKELEKIQKHYKEQLGNFDDATYQLLIMTWCNNEPLNKKPKNIRSYTFTILPFDIHRLDKAIDDYAEGYGIISGYAIRTFEQKIILYENKDSDSINNLFEEYIKN